MHFFGYTYRLRKRNARIHIFSLFGRINEKSKESDLREILMLIFVAEDVAENTRKQRLLALYLHGTIYRVGNQVIADFLIER